MWTNNHIVFRFILFLAFILLTACGSGSKTDNPNTDSGNITPRAVTGIEITSTNNEPTTNDTAELQVIATFDDGTSKDITSEITLESSNTEVVTITDGSLVTHEFIDDVTISATYEAEQVSRTFRVSAPANATLSSLEFLPDTDLVSLTPNSEIVVVAKYSDDYSIDKNKVFTINAIEPSTTDDSVTYELSNEDAKFTAVVTDPNQTSPSAPLAVLATLSSIVIQTSNSSVESGSTITVSAQALYSDDTSADITQTVDWTSNNVTSLEYVPNSNTFLANNVAGIANISASANAIVSNTLAIDIIVPVLNTPAPAEVTLDSISITPSSQEIVSNSSITFEALGQYSDQSTQTITADVNWLSSNTAVLESTNGNHIFNGKSTGSATVTASLGNINAAVEITVTQAAQSAVVTLQSLKITPTSSTIQAGESQTYILTGKYSDNPTTDVAITSPINWNISGSATSPTINNNTATFTPSNAGSYTVTATTEGQPPQTANLVVQVANAVIDPSVTNIQILLANDNPNLISNTQNNSVVVRLNYVDGSSETVTDQIAWEVEKPQLLTAIGGNIQTGSLLGQTRLTARLNTLGLQTFVNVSVIPKDGAAINAIEITEPHITMLTKSNTTLSVKGIYDDGSEALLTQGLNWFSNDELVASVDNTGQVTSNNLSTSTTISAIYTDPVSNITFTDGVTVNIFNTGSFDYIKIAPSNASSFTRVEDKSDLNVRPIIHAFENPAGLLKDIPLPSQNIGYYVTLVMPNTNERFALILDDLNSVNYDNGNATILYLPPDDKIAYISTNETSVNVTLTQFDTATGGQAIGNFSATLCRIGWDCTQSDSLIEVNGDFFATLENPKTYSGYEDKTAPKLIDEATLSLTQLIGSNSSYYQMATKIGTSYTVKSASSSADVGFSVYATNDFVSNKLGDSVVENASDQSVTFIADNMISYIKFDYDGVGPGSTFQISATALAPTAQGSETLPWVLPSDIMPVNYYKGQVDKTASFYQTSVVQGITYRVTIETNTNDLSLFAATNNTASAFTDCPYSTVDRFYRCVVLADSNNIFVKVDGSQTNTDGRDFTLKIEYHAVEEDLTVPTINHQGQVSNGITMNIDTGGGNGALNSSNSIYWIEEITANTYYLVSLTDFTDALQLWVRSPFSGNTLENGGCNTAGLPNTSEIYCLVKANVAGSMSINVISFAATSGSPYKISVRPINNNVYDIVTMGHENVDCSPCSANELAFYREGQTKAFAITSQDDKAYARKLIYADPGEKIFIQVTDPQRLGINYGITVNNNGSPPNQAFGSIGNPDIFEDGAGDDTRSNATPLELNRVSNHSLSNNNGNFGDEDWFVFTAP